MTVYTVGYLGKLWYEAMEGLNKTPLEATQAMGLNKYETALNVVVPESANDLISHSIFLFEYNFRSGTIIGIVGAGGIGYYIDLYLRFLQYDKVVAYLLIIFLVVLIIDFLSIYARSFFNEEDDSESPHGSGLMVRKVIIVFLIESLAVLTEADNLSEKTRL